MLFGGLLNSQNVKLWVADVVPQLSVADSFHSA